MNLRPLLALIVIALMAAPAAAAEKGQDKILLVHVTAPLDKDTDRTVLVFRVVAGALARGRHVALFFDAAGASSLRTGRRLGGHSTPLDRAGISGRERRDLAALLGTSADGIPDIYGSLMHFLKGKGVAIYVSKPALALRGIGDEQYDHAAEAVGEDRIVDLLISATAYVSY